MLATNAELREAAQLVTNIWAVPFPADVLRALELSRNYVSGAFTSDQTMVGASIAWAAIAEAPELHSHSTGVLMSHRHSGVGVALKLHQRSWALERGIEMITWTFDPLVRRNAMFNLARLGATADYYVENVYGSMGDALNGNDESDRLFVRWRLAAAAVEAASSGSPQWVRVETALPEALRPGPDDGPLLAPLEESGLQRFSCRVPDDIQSLRASRPDVAHAWRLAVRHVLGRALAGGGRLLGLDDQGDYVIESGAADSAAAESRAADSAASESGAAERRIAEKRNGEA
jgi:predicted GNAT superfamily acetyltransferase